MTPSATTALNITVGKVDLQSENGRIVYYNISIIKNSTDQSSMMQFHMVNISDFVPTLVDETDFMFNKRARHCEGEVATRLINCSDDFIKINATSDLANTTINDLDYWTEYGIRASACTCTGCGPFSPITYARTGEHVPTCATESINVTSFTSTSVKVTWIPLRPNCTNGFVIAYRIYFGSADNFSRTLNSSFGCQNFNESNMKVQYFSHVIKEAIQFNGLEKYSNYCIAVSAGTIKGFGPFSSAVCNLTLEDRKFLMIFLFHC